MIKQCQRVLRQEIGRFNALAQIYGLKGQKMKMLIVGIVLLAASPSGYASQVALAPTTITFVENGWFGEGLAIQTTATYSTSCYGGGTQFAVPITHPAYKDIVAIALAAYAIGSTVQIVIEDSTCAFAGRMSILSIRLLK